MVLAWVERVVKTKQIKAGSRSTCSAMTIPMGPLRRSWLRRHFISRAGSAAAGTCVSWGLRATPGLLCRPQQRAGLGGQPAARVSSPALSSAAAPVSPTPARAAAFLPRLGKGSDLAVAYTSCVPNHSYKREKSSAEKHGSPFYRRIWDLLHSS